MAKYHELKFTHYPNNDECSHITLEVNDILEAVEKYENNRISKGVMLQMVKATLGYMEQLTREEYTRPMTKDEFLEEIVRTV